MALLYTRGVCLTTTLVTISASQLPKVENDADWLPDATATWVRGGGAQIPRAGSRLGGTESPELTISAGLVSSGDSGEPVSDLADLRRARAALSQLS